jgi:hypothetical protein
MALRELSMDIACPEACFQAPSSGQCFEAIQTWISRSHRRDPILFSSFLKAFCQGEMNVDTQFSYANHGFMNLWAVVAGKWTVMRGRCSLLIQLS